MASSSTNIKKFTHEVFLSFRGADTRYTFTAHLHRALLDKGIYVFIDNELQRGEEITPQLLGVIKESRVSIVVLSEHYASSSFCLDELVKILECRESERQIVIPVFYHVNPTDVEEQTCAFGQEFARLKVQFNKPNFEGDFNDWKFITAKAVMFFRYILGWMIYTLPVIGRSVKEKNEGAIIDTERMQNWRLALTKVARLSGYHLKEGDHEANTIQDIVNKVSRRLDHAITLRVGENLVGLDSRVEYIHQVLKIESDDICMLGLHGMGGVGKTALGKALYNKWAKQFDFDGYCFLENVRENTNNLGLAQLQEKLLREILRDQNLQLENSDKGIEVIKHRLGCKRVLILIDDVDGIEQLQKLAGELEWFGAGSKIIITTRNSRLLEEHDHVTIKYEVKKLEDDLAIELFSWHAFTKPQPEEAYLELTYRAIRYAQGLPLALKVLGSSLYKRSVRWWGETLKKLEQCGDDKIFNVLKVSYDSLDSKEKNIFLDIAFFLQGKNKDIVMKFLDGCGFYGYTGVKKLIEKSLLYDSGGVVRMHGLLEEMGIRIAFENSSRLCIRNKEDIPHLSSRDKRTYEYEVEMLVLDLYGEEEVALNWLQNLTKLRALAILNGCFIKMPKNLPKSIRWLEWRNSGLMSIPFGFLPHNLLVLEMPYSISSKFLINMPKAQKFIDLTRMNFRGSKHLRKIIIDFSSIPNIEELDLSGCTKLKKIHKSVGSLKKLQGLNLWECCSLASLPNLVQNKCLCYLSLFGCSKLENLPNLPTNLFQLNLENSGIKEIPMFIGNLINLKYIGASYCKNLITVSNGIYKLLPYASIYLNNCSNLLQLPEAESSILSYSPTSKTYHRLDLSGNEFVSLPTNTFKFMHIVDLILNNCTWVVEIPELPRTLLSLEARNCKSLVRFSQFQFDDHFMGDFRGCHKILRENEMKSWREMVEKKWRNEVYPKWKYSIIVPGNEVPQWFSYAFNCHGTCHSFKLPSSLLNANLIGIACSAIFDDITSIRVSGIQFSINEIWIHRVFLHSPIESEHMLLGFTSVHFESDYDFRTWSEGEEILCEFHCDDDRQVVLKRVGVHFIYKN